MKPNSFTHALVLLIACLVATGNDREYPRLARSLFWKPYTYDAQTVALFHLDKEAPPSDKMPTDEELLGDLLTATPSTKARPAVGSADEPGAANAVPTGVPAALRGSTSFVADGRLGGALRFDRNDGALLFDQFTLQSPSRTVECWVKLAELPKVEAVLFHFAEPPRRRPGAYQADAYNRSLSSVSLLILPDGQLACDWYGRRLAIELPPLRVGSWTHVACAMSTEWPWKSKLLVYSDGHPAPPLSLPREELGKVAQDSQQLLVGNDLTMTRGIVGWIDEVRLSRRVREFYIYELDWAPVDAATVAGDGQPYFRDADDLLLNLPFDYSLQPAKATPGTDLPKEAASTFDPDLDAHLFAPGVSGAALLLGDGTLRPAYGAAGNLDPNEGTIAFWLLPLDWDNLTRDNRYDQVQPTVFGLFQLIGHYVDGSHARLFSPTGPTLQFNLNLHLPETSDQPVDLAPGEWRHIAMTWVGTDFTYYVDGEARNPDGAWESQLELRTPDDPYPYKQLNPRWWTESKPLSLTFRERRYWDQLSLPVPRSRVDEFRIYRRALSPSEIANLVALHDSRRTLEPLPVADMQVHYNGVSGKTRVTIVPLVAGYRHVTGADVWIVREGSDERLGEAKLLFDERHQGSIVVTTPPLEFATYRVMAELRNADGTSAGTVQHSFTRVAPPWWESTAGLSTKVMPEWTPVEVDGRAIRVWGREIRFAGSGLPEQIVSAGEPILTSPIRVTATRDGAELALQPGEPRLKAIDETRAEAEGLLSGDGLRLLTRSQTEFDGMIWFDVTIEPEGETAALSSLTVEITYRAANAELLHWWSGSRNFREPRHVHIGALPAEEGVHFASNAEEVRKPENLRGSFIPYVMLTGMARGMAWFGENDKGWTQSTDKAAVSIERRGETVILVLRIIADPITLKESRTFSFGLHPTPVRKLEPHWRMSPSFSNIFPDSFSGNNLKGRKGPAAFNTYPEDDWESVQRRIEGEGLTKGAPSMATKAQGFLESFEATWGRPPLPVERVTPGLYWDMQWTGHHPAHTREWAECWGLGQGDFQHYSKSFNNFAAWSWEQWLVQTNGFVQGVYLDDCWGAPQVLESGPVAYALDDGHVQPGYQIRGYRERVMRMRQISWDHGIVPRLTAHTTHTFFIPWHSCFDLILDGEDHYANPPEQHTFIDRWPLDRMRFMHNGKWGLITTWLPWHGNSLDIDKWPAWTYRHRRAYTASMAMHDIMWKFDQAIIQRFGLREPETVTIPYWNDGGLASHEHADLRAGAWKNERGCLLLLVNVGKERIEANVHLDKVVMGFDPGDALRIEDVDSDLLVYFAEDTTAMETPDAADVGAVAGAELDISLEENDSELPEDERRARDPDGKYQWQDERLLCPVRPNDYRLFLFTR